jgi:lipoate-protein ligase A
MEVHLRSFACGPYFFEEALRDWSEAGITILSLERNGRSIIIERHSKLEKVHKTAKYEKNIGFIDKKTG